MKKKYRSAVFLMLLVYMSVCGNYINNDFDGKIIYLYGLIDFLIINTIMILIPLILKLSGNISQNNGSKICKYNSIIIYAISILLNCILKANFYIGIGGIGAIVYYFINMKLFVDNEDNK